MASIRKKRKLYCYISLFITSIPMFMAAQVNNTLTPGVSDVCALLLTKENFPEKDSNLALYDGLIGSWKVKSTWYNNDGTKNEGSGEWHFQKIIGGRGVLDVIYGTNTHVYDYGTTLRCYDKSINSWRASFMQPASREFANFIGHKTGDMIVHEGTELSPKQGRIRWTFKEITANTFHWTGEFSDDGGKTWKLEQEMYGSKM